MQSSESPSADYQSPWVFCVVKQWILDQNCTSYLFVCIILAWIDDRTCHWYSLVLQLTLAAVSYSACKIIVTVVMALLPTCRLSDAQPSLYTNTCLHSNMKWKDSGPVGQKSYWAMVIPRQDIGDLHGHHFSFSLTVILLFSGIFQ
jgi:hypothetical protein